MEDGFLIIRGVVPPSLAHAALAEINRSLLKLNATTVGEDGKITHCTDAGKSERILALLYGTPLWTIAQRLIGRGRVKKIQAAQVAPIAPALDTAPATWTLPRQWHFDGMLPSKHWSPFALLLGVALSDQTLPNCGNLIAFKGSHHILQPMVREESQAPGTHPFLSEDHAGIKPELSNGEQILLGIGDAVLLHQKTAHRVGVNCSPNIRYQTYFRLPHVDMATHISDGSVHQGLWRQFGGLEGDGDVQIEPVTKQLNDEN